MNPLFRLELRYLRRMAPAVAVWVLTFAVPIALLALNTKRPRELWIALPLMVIFGQAATAVWIARQTEPLALTVPLSPWARIRGRFLVMITVAAPSALVAALATYPWGVQKGPDLVVHFLNLFLSCLGSSLAYAVLFPVVEGLSSGERIFALLFVSAVVLG